MSKPETAVAWKQNLVRGDVIKVAIPSDKNENGNQKSRSAIVLENENDNNSPIPTLVVQILSLLSNWVDEKKDNNKLSFFNWNEKTFYVQAHDFRKISYEIIHDSEHVKFDDKDEPMQLIKRLYNINDEWSNIKPKAVLLTVADKEKMDKLLKEQQLLEKEIENQKWKNDRDEIERQEQEQKLEEAKAEIAVKEKNVQLKAQEDSGAKNKPLAAEKSTKKMLKSAKSEIERQKKELEKVKAENKRQEQELEKARTEIADKAKEIDQLKKDVEASKADKDKIAHQLEKVLKAKTTEQKQLKEPSTSEAKSSSSNNASQSSFSPDAINGLESKDESQLNLDTPFKKCNVL